MHIVNARISNLTTILPQLQFVIEATPRCSDFRAYWIPGLRRRKMYTIHPKLYAYCIELVIAFWIVHVSCLSKYAMYSFSQLFWLQADCRGDEIELGSFSQLIGACAQIRLGIQHVRDVDAAFKSHEKSILALVMLYISETLKFFSVQLIPKSRVDPDSRTLRAVPVFKRCLHQVALWYRVWVPGFHQIVGKDSSICFYSFSAGAVPVNTVNIVSGQYWYSRGWCLSGSIPALMCVVLKNVWSLDTKYHNTTGKYCIDLTLQFIDYDCYFLWNIDTEAHQTRYVMYELPFTQ